MTLPYPITKTVALQPGMNDLTCDSGALCADFDMAPGTVYTLQFIAGDTTPKFFTVSDDLNWHKGVPAEPPATPAPTGKLVVACETAQDPKSLGFTYVEGLPAGTAHVKIWSNGLSTEEAERSGLQPKAAGTDFAVTCYLYSQPAVSAKEST